MSWQIREGDELTRQEVHRRCGGQRRGGISTPEGSSNILLFATSGGQQYGYQDGFNSDGSFTYTGEGQEDDQLFVRGNAALLHHRKSKKTLRLFRETKKSWVRYLGEYFLDSERPYRFEDAPDGNNTIRRVIVFRLHRAGVSTGEVEPPPLTVTDVDLDVHRADTFLVEETKVIVEAERRESMLVQRYAKWLEGLGHVVKQRTMKGVEHAAPLRSDLYDVTADELVEAKGSAARTYIRLAIGQILDYGRYAHTKHRAILVPARPSEDMIDLLKTLRISCIYEQSKGKFERIEATVEFCPACPIVR
jgi:hypothetical protein